MYLLTTVVIVINSSLRSVSERPNPGPDHPNPCWGKWATKIRLRSIVIFIVDFLVTCLQLKNNLGLYILFKGFALSTASVYVASSNLLKAKQALVPLFVWKQCFQQHLKQCFQQHLKQCFQQHLAQCFQWHSHSLNCLGLQKLQKTCSIRPTLQIWIYLFPKLLCRLENALFRSLIIVLYCNLQTCNLLLCIIYTKSSFVKKLLSCMFWIILRISNKLLTFENKVNKSSKNSCKPK